MSDDQPHNMHDIIQEMMYGKDGLAKRRREAELEHERKLAEVRRESHALVWTGAAEELTATITRWYESGWLQAESLQDALQKARIHFIKPDGTPAIRIAALSTTAESAIFSASATYQKITFHGKEYDLTGHKYAADILRVLHASFIRNELGLTIGQIRRQASLPHNGTMYDWFRSTGLWKTLVVKSRDLYRLDI